MNAPLLTHGSCLPKPFKPVACALLLMLTSLVVTGCGGSDSASSAPGPVAVADTACAKITDGGSVTVGSGLAGDPAAPEPASGYRTGTSATYAKTYMVVTANPLASAAGCEVLKKGGSAVDAAIAAQMVLGLVEPQSSGIGGGAFMLHYDASTKKVLAYDGRETAPAAATEDYLRYISDTQQTTPLPNPRASGRSIGTPGVLRLLELAHTDHGKLPWKDLFQNGIDLASNGFKISGRLSDAISASAANLQRDDEAAAYFLNADGTPKSLGTLLKNPAYAGTLTTLANSGASAFYTGAIAQGIVNKIKVASGGNPAVSITPGLTEMSDLAGYQAKKRESVCTSYRTYWICGMPPPSSGGIAVAQTLGILENYYLAGYKPTAMDLEGGKPTVLGVHLVSEAQRLAYADRDKYVADTDFVSLPGGSPSAMVSKDYLRGRANLIRFDKSMGVATAGVFGGSATPLGIDATPESGTSHITVVDKRGNVAVITTTVESTLGSFHMTQGFMLNNQLTDFSAAPKDASGQAIANRVQASKRPRSSMAPTLVFKAAADGGVGDFVMGTGSPGGATIIQYVSKTLVAVLDWGLNAQQAANLVNFGANNSVNTNVGGEHPNVNVTNSGNNDPLITGLRAMGHTVSTAAQTSGIGIVIRTSVAGAPAYEGGADPRREGYVLGDTFKP